MTDLPRNLPRGGGGGLRRDAGLLLGAHGVYRLSGFALLMVASRLFSADQLGAWFFAESFAETFLVIATLGLDPVLMRRAAADPDHPADHLRPMLGFRLASAPAYLAVVALAALFAPRASLPLILFVAGYTLMESVYASFGALFLGLRKARYNVAIGLTAEALFLALVFGGLIVWRSLSVLLAATAVRAGYLVVVAWVVARRRYGRLAPTWDGAFVRAGLPFVAMTFLLMLQGKLGALLLGFLADNQAVGHYQLAFRCVSAAFFIPVALSSVLFPVFVNGGLHGAAPAFRRAGLALTALAAVGAAGTVVFADPVARLLYGPAGPQVAPVLRLLALVLPVHFLAELLSWALQALYQERLALRALASGTAVSITAHLVLIPTFGARGAAAAFILAALYRLTAMAVSLWRLRAVAPVPSPALY